MYRTHTCGQLRKKDIGKEITLSGWVNSRRDHGGVVFIDLRDRYGITQVKCDPKISKNAWRQADKVRDEYVIKVAGKVKARPKDMLNPRLETGEIEVEAQTVEILNTAKTPPFEIAWPPGDDVKDKAEETNEEVRLKYRYLDLRRKKMVKNLCLRYKLIKFIRDFLEKEGFIEIETPLLTKSTPEGARDFIVPSRLNPGKFYALPQSPQQYKQMLMVAGIDKYFQIAPCLRDEDARADRSPGEFYQLDLEMSFVEQKDILDLTERLFTQAAEKLIDKKIMKKPWPRISWDEVMLKYGVDKPDLRFGLEIQDISKLVKDCGFKVFSDTVKKGGVVRAVNGEGAAKFSRSELDKLEGLAQDLGAPGLGYVIIDQEINPSTNSGRGKSRNQENKKTKNQENNFKSPLLKFIGEEKMGEIVKEMKGKPGDIIFFMAGEELKVAEILGQIRLELGRKLGLIDDNLLAFCYVVDWPLFEPGMTDGHFSPAHHMFTMPKEKDWPKLDTAPEKVKSYQHDMVLNGFEVAGGSIRIHRPDIQEKIFKLIGFNKERIKFFSHMLEAFKYGAPPHGGIAPGIERIAMLFAGEESIREMMAFPKNSRGEDVMIGAPSEVEQEQLKELGIEITRHEARNT
ncbi:aspartate--tRNA ligase [Patescibacteria group bacterium]|nr:aspartate--tRNA ligase [Patescibacteria group bacterium]MBU4512634.1 aspartate--tRNA ligase [Patescibacteria group bacterium]MCG2693540.1 aspartate--tRNA ligase [Candidatus Parcubacteria bacterium]